MEKGTVSRREFLKRFGKSLFLALILDKFPFVNVNLLAGEKKEKTEENIIYTFDQLKIGGLELTKDELNNFLEKAGIAGYLDRVELRNPKNEDREEYFVAYFIVRQKEDGAQENILQVVAERVKDMPYARFAITILHELVHAIVISYLDVIDKNKKENLLDKINRYITKNSGFKSNYQNRDREWSKDRIFHEWIAECLVYNVLYTIITKTKYQGRMKEMEIGSIEGYLEKYSVSPSKHDIEIVEGILSKAGYKISDLIDKFLQGLGFLRYKSNEGFASFIGSERKK